MNIRRLRRMRLTEPLRALRRETKVDAGDLIMPLFINETLTSPRPISSMPGILQLDPGSVLAEIRQLQDLGLGGAILFGIPTKKDAQASGAWQENGVVQTAIRRIKDAGLELPIIADTCLCEYTADGHCGPLDPCGHVDNDKTLKILAETALSQAKAGADMVAPSTMIDGMIRAIREKLDHGGFSNTPILSYGAKFASQFYGPFRDAAGSGENFKGNRRNHQMDPANGREARLELQQDAIEGADLLMVKPALAYLDVVARAQGIGLPVWAYNVSGEYSMVKASAAAGYCDERAMVSEILTSIKRAGADRIISYHAKAFAGWD